MIRRGSLTLAADSAGHSTISAQDLLKITRGFSGFLRKKEAGHLRLSAKWPHRFMILNNDAIFLYEHESSKSPKAVTVLTEYKAVTRYSPRSKVHDWCFSIVPGNARLRPIKFACASDKDRRTWMAAVKKLLYVANRISEPAISFEERFASLAVRHGDEEYSTIDADDNEEYTLLEEPVFQEFAGVSPAEGEDDCSDSDMSDQGKGRLNRISDISTNSRNRSSDISTSSGNRISDISTSSGSGSGSFPASRSTGMWSSYGGNCDAGSAPPKPTTAATTTTSKKPFQRRQSDPVPLPQAPPLPCGRKVSASCSDYVNTRPRLRDENDYEICQDESEACLLDQCSMLGRPHSREDCLCMLREGELGTYLIRDSRNDVLKVLSLQAGDDGLKELKIFEIGGKYSLDKNNKFESLEELLKFYTMMMPVPRTNVFLKQGIHHSRGGELGD
ncbi:uncharacterized protein LOC106012619 [Aplysia californica]|uniref:Uncharacterized protein LOC106012619 n=1 Tax=Aplysia californica TaxID=6500 RepID=A0ABM1A632_APLCA|nr:uncharacterized protein LOC106012619 [Aplysia californica]